MAIISTHEGVFKWLARNGLIGNKRKNKNKVDLIISEYKKQTGNEFHYYNFYPNKTHGKNWDKSIIEFKQFTKWALNNLVKINS
jgi:hypothetical protein